jgi:fluoroquinolone transport system ATP-binding protein
MIEVKDMTFTYPGGKKEAAKNISFNIKKGEIFGFLGPSGAGKSTTQKILTGQLRGYKGDITVMGKDVRAWKSDYYEKIGVSFGSQPLPRLTAMENELFPLAVQRRYGRPRGAAEAGRPRRRRQ